MSDIIIDHDYRLGPKPPSLRRRISTRALVLVAWGLGTTLTAMLLLSAALSACAQLRCWTL